MQESKRLQRARPGPDPASPFDPPQSGAGGAVTVTHGIYAEELPVAQMSVAQVRARFADRLDIHPEATALLDGRPADDDVRVQAGQILSFIRPAGEKGGLFDDTLEWLRAAGGPAAGPTGQLELAMGGVSTRRMPRGRRAAKTAAGEPVVTIEGSEVCARTPEGATARVALTRLLDRIRPDVPQTGDAVLPDGVKAVLPAPGSLVVVHQTPPRVHAFRWIAADSGADYGPGTSYRDVRLALPYVVVLAVFEARGGTFELGSRNECFFSNRPLDAKGLETPLCYPALLNCSRFPSTDRHPLSWICTQHLVADECGGEGSRHEILQRGLAALLRHLFESGFNRSSENHELSSWFAETVQAEIDPRLASVEAWEEATRADPLFALEVPWLDTGMTLRQIAGRVTHPARRRAARPATARDLAGLVFRLQRSDRRSA